MSSDTSEYRKYKSGMEFMKLKGGAVVSVLNSENACRIIYSCNSHLLKDFRDNTVSMESSEIEFAQAMHRALQEINKIS